MGGELVAVLVVAISVVIMAAMDSFGGSDK